MAAAVSASVDAGSAACIRRLLSFVVTTALAASMLPIPLTNSVSAPSARPLEAADVSIPVVNASPDSRAVASTSSGAATTLDRTPACCLIA